MLLLEEVDESGIFEKVSAVDLLLVAHGEEDGELSNVFIAVRAVIKVGAASVETGRNLGLLGDLDEILDVIVRVLDVFEMTNGHGGQHVELFALELHGIGALLAPIIV